MISLAEQFVAVRHALTVLTEAGFSSSAHEATLALIGVERRVQELEQTGLGRAMAKVAQLAAENFTLRARAMALTEALREILHAPAVMNPRLWERAAAVLAEGTTPQTSAPRSVGEDFPKQQARVRELLAEYRKIGPAGAFGAMMLGAALDRANKAAISGDVVAVLKSYHELKECE